MKKLFLLAALLLCMCVGAIAQAKVVYDGPIGIDWKFNRSFSEQHLIRGLCCGEQHIARFPGIRGCI